MNEQRQQAYLDLIQQLLNCPSGEEPNLESLSEAEIRAYEHFLLHILQVMLYTEDADIVEALLKKNLTKLNSFFIDILKRWATAMLVKVEIEVTQLIAKAIFNFSNLIQQFSSGNKADNMEIAIAGYEIVLTVYTLKTFPQDWAAIQNNLANTYSNRIKGDKAKNIEQAIASYTAALRVFTRKAFPQNWAMTQNNLGEAYRVRIRGSRAENLERAITCSTAALEIRTRDAFPQDWAQTQNNLANAYSERIWGERAENLEKAIVCYTAALQVRTREAFPKDWAQTQNNLAIAYADRIRGERAENLERAIASYTAALEVYTHEAFPQDWAITQSNLASAYHKRLVGEKSENLERAIASYTAALEVYTREAFPQDWATTQNNLANVYSERILGEISENIERAISSYTAALQVRTREAFPEYWAQTKNNLALAYCKRIRGEKTENLERAVASYSAALEVRTREKFPLNNAETLWNLALVYRNTSKFQLAYCTLADAIETVETLRGEIYSGNEVKQLLSEEWNKLYRSIVEVCLNLKNYTAALEYAEKSKNRNLVEGIYSHDFKSILPRRISAKLETLRDKIATEQYQIQQSKAENPKALVQNLKKLRKQRNELQDKYLPVGYSFNFNKFKKTLNKKTSIVEYYLTFDSLETFLITLDNVRVSSFSASIDDFNDLMDWHQEYLSTYLDSKIEWKDKLADRLTRLSAILHLEDLLKLLPPTCTRLVLIPHLYLHLFPLHALPLSDGSVLADRFPDGVSYAPSCQIFQQVQQRKRSQFQSLFAVQNPTEDLLYTNLEVQTIKNGFQPATVLERKQATLSAVNAEPLDTVHCVHFSCHGYFNLENPSQSALILADALVAEPPANPDSERYLNIREGETHDRDRCLTLDKIFSLKLDSCRLVTLSACETGLIDFRNISDEYIGLPSGFLLAGSPSVVSSLWAVNDLSTSFLMMKFYDNLREQQRQNRSLNVAIALNSAQQWLRTLTVEEFDRVLEQLQPQIDEMLEKLSQGKRLIFKESLKQIRQRKPCPFANPYYWAAFTANGL